MKSVAQKPLSGPEKAAVLLLVAGTEHAGKVFHLLSGEEIKTVAGNISRLGMVRGDMAHTICHHFLEQATGIIGTKRRAEIVLHNILGQEQAEAIIEELKTADANAIWEKVSAIDAPTLAHYLKDEHPQTIAIVLSHIAPRRAAEVFPLFEQKVSCEVLKRILKTDTVQSGLLAEVGKTLRAELLNAPQSMEKKNVHMNVAKIFNYMENETSEAFLSYLDQNEQEDATRVRALMIRFEDLTKIRIESLEVLFHNINPSRLALALKVAPEHVRKFFLDHLSEEALQLLQEETELLGVVRVREVSHAQAEIIATAKRLIRSGKVQLLSAKKEEEVPL
ncbi:MAG: hypothetical protein LBJ70_04880 [Holosporales bacterium]|jgi:flagellar motor switch protein FliG|nr:hypothetical protein [Holosporales bacterium]